MKLSECQVGMLVEKKEGIGPIGRILPDLSKDGTGMVLVSISWSNNVYQFENPAFLKPYKD